jgi:RNA polymerase sigma-70 factor (ECF subfamily)
VAACCLQSMSPRDQVESLFLSARDDVFRYLVMVGLEAAQAQETTQDVFLRLYVALRDGETIENPRAWVFRVAHNMGLNARARSRFTLALDDGFAARLKDSGRTPEDQAIERQRIDRFHRSIQALPRQQRNCLYLRAEGLRYHEIASVIGVSASTVCECLRRATAKLRKEKHA